MPSGDGLKSVPTIRPASDTPALANANSGMTPNSTHGCDVVLQTLAAATPFTLHMEWHCQRHDHARQRRVHTRFQHTDPDEDARSARTAQCRVTLSALSAASTQMPTAAKPSDRNDSSLV